MCLKDLWLAAALASNAVGKGDVCVLLSDWAGKPTDLHEQLRGNLFGEHGTLPEQYPDLAAMDRTAEDSPGCRRARRLQAIDSRRKASALLTTLLGVRRAAC